jgi:hypothetical protein
MTGSKRNIFAEVEKVIRYKHMYFEKLELFEILIKIDLCGIKIFGFNCDGEEYIAQLFEKDKSLDRITYILIKWHNQQLKGGGGIVKYFLWEEIPNYSLPRKINKIKA